MSLLPPDQTPLNQHSLKALETWLIQLGAQQSSQDLCLWLLVMPHWSAEIKIRRDEVQVTWDQEGKQSHCSFPYGLSRRDVHIAIAEGP